MTDYVKVVLDEFYQKFSGAAAEPWWTGAPIRDVCTGLLEVGGRTTLTLFAADGERTHPRLRTEPLPVSDPSPRAAVLQASKRPPRTVEELLSLVGRTTTSAAAWLAAEELAPGDPAPLPGERYRQNRVSAQRRSQLFSEVRSLLQRCARDGAWSDEERDRASYALAELEWAAHSGEIRFDDEDIGTYFAYTRDRPFVHYLEQLLARLPEPGSEAMAVLPKEQRAAVRRQRTQATNHLDHLMRRAYAFDSVIEADIERSLGALMVQRRTHLVVSHDDWQAGKGEPPGYELLRLDPRGDHPHAGAWIHRAGADLRLRDGTVIDADPQQVLATPLSEDDITFQRAPGDPRLRSGMHFDWDSNGYITDEPLPGINWGGFCDVQALMELHGLTFTGGPGDGVTEFRSDTGEVVTYNPSLLREMAASALEPGSAYKDLETREWLRVNEAVEAGVGVGNKADRLDFATEGRRTLYWPREGGREDFKVLRMEGPDGAAHDLVGAFHRNLVDSDSLSMRPNPRFKERLGGNFHIIDARGLLLQVQVRVHVIDEETGYFRQERRPSVVDLRQRPEHRRCFLGTRLWNSTRREVYRYYLDRDDHSVVTELDRYELVKGRWRARALHDHNTRTPLARPLSCTLMRQVLRDDPVFFAPLLHAALVRGEAIIADTHMKEEVWNGLVTRMDARLVASDPATRVERWQVDLKARHGASTMDYLLRRARDGMPVDACPAPGPDGWGDYPDFLWQQQPDVGTCIRRDGRRLVNMAMLARGLVAVDEEQDPVQVQDDHLRNVSEILFCALDRYPHVIVHNNVRYGFRNEDAWRRAVGRLTALRRQLRFRDSKRDRKKKRRIVAE